MSTAVARDGVIVEEPVPCAKIFRAAAFLVSAHGEDAARHARRLETESAVPDIARRVRMEVERLLQASVCAGEMQSASAALSGTGS